jgi:uncharacterized protein YndB with AHSA1/START domain
MFTIVGIIIAVSLLGVLGVAATKPDTLRVVRTTLVQAPPEKIFAFINDFRLWSAWSPYEARDPSMQRTYGNVTVGRGAVYEWSGDRNVGQGRMEIIAADAPSRVAIKLDIVKPMEGHNIVTFSLQTVGRDTEVTWAMDAPMPYMSRVMSVFINMDTMIGKDFEVGLAKLKAVSER